MSQSPIISNWFIGDLNEITAIQWHQMSPDLNPPEHIWDVVDQGIHIVVVKLTILQKLGDSVMSKKTRIFVNILELLNYVREIKILILKTFNKVISNIPSR